MRFKGSTKQGSLERQNLQNAMSYKVGLNRLAYVIGLGSPAMAICRPERLRTQQLLSPPTGCLSSLSLVMQARVVLSGASVHAGRPKKLESDVSRG